MAIKASACRYDILTACTAHNFVCFVSSLQTVLPFVLTAMSASVGHTKPGFFVPGPDKYARAAVSTIGIQTTTYGYWPHALQVCIPYSGLILGVKNFVKSANWSSEVIFVV